jgi:hypothetical protein
MQVMVTFFILLLTAACVEAVEGVGEALGAGVDDAVTAGV